MPLQSSGPISLKDVADEFLDSAPHSLSEFYSAATGVPASGALRLGADFYGKANIFAFTISSNQTNANLRTLAVNAGWDQVRPLQATINSGIYIVSNSRTGTALTVNGSFPNGVTLINNGFIIGTGGNGGRGGNRTPPSSSQCTGVAGLSGGKALDVSSAIAITNNGTIAGGGGGGGGGGASYSLSTEAGWTGGGGGGGRTSFTNTSGGAAGVTSTTGSAGAGGTGTLSSAGGGGARAASPNNAVRGGNGGSGGNWGSNGGAGASGTQVFSYTGFAGGSGGAAGAAVTGNSLVTWNTTGTRLGPIS